MRVLFFTYPSNRWTPGGKETELRDAYRELENLGVKVSMLDPWAWEDADHYEILHLFGSEYYQHELGTRAAARGIKIVVTAILGYADRRTQRLTKLWRYVDPILPVATTFGLRRDLLRSADAVICFSQTEAKEARDVYGVSPESIHVVPLSVPISFADGDPELFRAQTGLSDYVLCVGRIHPPKNQLRLIQATAPLDKTLVLIGDFDSSHSGYARAVREALNRHGHAVHVPGLPAEDPLLISAFAGARVHALVSHHERLGMVNLEAGLSGANLVTTRLPDTYEILGDLVWYASSRDIKDIGRQIERAYDAPPQTRLRELIMERYTTPTVARRLVDVYEKVVEAG